MLCALLGRVEVQFSGLYVVLKLSLFLLQSLNALGQLTYYFVLALDQSVDQISLVVLFGLLLLDFFDSTVNELYFCLIFLGCGILIFEIAAEL